MVIRQRARNTTRWQRIWMNIYSQALQGFAAAIEAGERPLHP
jgi:hypothetical protein